MYVKVSPMKGVTRFGKKGKLSPRYEGPFEVMERVGAVAYRLELPVEMQGMHNFFHVSSLKKSFGERQPVVVEAGSIRLQPNLSYKEWPVQIMDGKEQQLSNQKVSLVKVLWTNPALQEATWKREDLMRTKHPHLFVT
ncbi:hypothetical protein F2P56_035513 [Juglans regia]|uniref:Tf2-1-like SH3-like domain-containing protein n=2 Tax=Juglans regia TaxID=51240 RepID=A0A833U271_JUGRE|nr:uncharacterized protein LOC109005644 [Juglans regia]KAF5442905.1 hypothetical protein F2P56_035513 [Juglans regia]